MSQVFDKRIIVKKKEDGTFTLAIAINDYTVVTQTLSEKALRQLVSDLKKILEG